MLKTCRAGSLLLLTAFFSLSLYGQNYFFAESREPAISPAAGMRVIVPDVYRNLVLDRAGLNNFLQTLPLETNIAGRASLPVIEIPMPDGKRARFKIWESPVMEPGLSAKFPNIRTYTGQGIDDPTATLKVDITELGLHAMILSDVTGDVFIDPYRQMDTGNYIVYYKKDLRNKKTFIEYDLIPSSRIKAAGANKPMAGPCIGPQLRSYRLAVACTGEYARRATGLTNPTVAQALSAIVTTITRVDGIYEKELAISLNLVADNDKIVFVDPSSDPFTANNDGSQLLNESQSVITQFIGSANYDIGHTFSTGGGGIAQVGSVCGPQKARGVTGSPEPTGDPYDIDYVAHEMGHQFDASHTFNAVTSSCGGNRSPATAVEPGSGITIMGYAGICGSANNLAINSIPYFHAISMDEINTFTVSGDGATCATITNTGNQPPVVEAGDDYLIPKSTSFVLSGSASDPNGDALTYSWEQVDTGPAGSWNNPAGNAPIFRSFVPSTNPQRHFPQLSDQARNKTTIGEILPSYARSLAFRLTVRDNRAGGGGVCYDEMQVNVHSSSGPFKVTAPNTAGISWEAGSVQIVTWDVANTDISPISCTNVSIQLSLDSGYTFPITILASTPNDGIEQIVVPNNVTTKARIRVMAVGNIFYDISDNNFEITPPQEGFNFTIPAAKTVNCGDNAAATATVNLQTHSVLGYNDPITLSSVSSPPGTTVSFSSNTITPGQSVVVSLNNVNTLSNGNYTVVVKGVSGTVVREQEISFIVEPGTGPAITAQPADVAICASRHALFNVTSASPVKAYQWQVSTNNGTTFVNMNNETGASLTVVNATAGQDNNRYRVLITGQCNITTSQPALLTVHANPTVSLAALPMTTLTPGQIITLTATPSASTGGTIDLAWTFNQQPVPISGATEQVDVTQLGTYQVTIFETWADGNVCSSESPVVTVSAAPSSQLYVYPSPNNGRFIVSYYNSTGGNTRQSVSIYDSKGAKVYYKEFSFTGPYELHDIDIRGKAKGVYFIVIGDADGKKLADGKVLIN